MSEVNTLEATIRTEFGKGAARRTRRAGKVPAVLHGHGTDPQHLALDARDFAAILRRDGSNAVLSLRIHGRRQLALAKSVVVHPIRRHIEHADLLVVQRGETVTVDVPVIVVGNAFPGALVTQEVNTVALEAEALHIPDNIEVSVQGARIGTQIHAADLSLPQGVSLAAGDTDTLVVNVLAPAVDASAEAAAGESAAE